MPSSERDTEEFVRELTACQDDLFFFIRSLCGDLTAAADIRQDVNVILWRKRENYRLGTNFKAWAFQTAKFEVKSYMRKARKDSIICGDPELLDLFAEEVPATIDQLPERRLALLQCLKSLTEKDSELLKHHYWTDLNLESLAHATNRSTGTLKARLFQLRHSLRHCIRRHMSPETGPVS